MPDYRMSVQELLILSDATVRRVEWVRAAIDTLSLVATAKVPGGTSRYPYDGEPYDRKVILEKLPRKVRLET